MLSRFRKKLSKYLFVLRWLVRDLLWQYRARVTTVLIFRSLGLALQLGSFGLLAYYARLLETDATINFFNETIRARESLTLLVFLAIVAFFAMTSGSVLNFFATRITEYLAGDYEQFCSRRVLRITGQLNQVSLPEVDHLEDERLIMALMKPYPRMLRRIARMVLTSVIPSLLLVVVTFPLLFYLNAWLTLLVVALIAASLVGHYRLSIIAGKSSLDYERSGKAATAVYRYTLNQLVRQSTPLDDRTVRQSLRARPVRRNLRALLTRLLTKNTSQFISDLTTATVLALILAVLGGQILLQGEGWTALVLYLVALKYSMSQARGLLTSMTKINRFFHQAHAYFLFLALHEPQPDSDESDHSGVPFVVECDSSLALPQSDEKHVVQAGDRVAVYCRHEATRFRVYQLYHCLFADAESVVAAAWSRTHIANELTTNNGATPAAEHSPDSQHSDPTAMIVAEHKVRKSEYEAEGQDSADEAPPQAEDDSQENDGAARLFLVRKLKRLPDQCNRIIIVDDEGVRWIGCVERIDAVVRLLDDLSYTERSAGSVSTGDDDDDES